MQKLWSEKTIWQRKEEFTAAEYYKKRASITPEFSKIICISVGYLFLNKSENHFRIKSFFEKNEKQILSEFNARLNSKFSRKNNRLCAHNGKEFDFPFIAKRTLVNELKLAKILDISNKKPWEVNLLDTMEIWRFGNYKNYVSIKLLATLFNIPTAKDNIDGNQVTDIYYGKNNFEKIKLYCQQNTLTVAQLFLRYKGEELIKNSIFNNKIKDGRFIIRI